MTPRERYFPTLPEPAPLVIPPHSALPEYQDEGMLVSASARMRQSSQAFSDLLDAAPERLTPRADRIKPSADPATAFSDLWTAYWDARAPGTPISRREQADQLYIDHLEASAQAAFARRTLSAEQLEPLLALLNADEDTATLQRLTLRLSDDSTVELPGACVIEVGDDRTDLLLYLPMRPLAVSAFARRSDAEQWLSGQSLIPAGRPTTGLRIEYATSPYPITQTMTALLGREPYRSFGDGRVFAAPEDVEISVTEDDDEPALFGSLYADIPWPQRQLALNRQRDALEALMSSDGDAAAQQRFKDAFKALEAAEVEADRAAQALLYRETALDRVTLNRELNALHEAHKAGLHAEARLQHALQHISDTEHSVLKALLDTPDSPGVYTVAASLTLTRTERDEEDVKVSSETLKGPFVMGTFEALLDPDSPHGLLLYWPGSGGGLQRFASRRELERQVFKIEEQNPDLALRLSKINGDPLRLALEKLLGDLEDQTRLTCSSSDEIAALRKRYLAALQVPVNAARSLAFHHLLEQDRSATLAIALPDWLNNLRNGAGAELKQRIRAYIEAMHSSHDMLTVTLIPRDDFTRQHVHARLREDFAVSGDFDVQIDLPDSVAWRREAVPAPGHLGQREIMVPSAERSTMSLEALAQLNIDNTPSMQLEPFALRLRFMDISVTAKDAAERKRLTDGITLSYLQKMLPQLNLPGAYEQLIFQTFMGKTGDAAFVNAHRRECLTEPWRQMLKLQGQYARLQKQVRETDLAIFDIAVDATTPEAWRAQGKRIVLLPATLTVGGKDTPREGPVTLSGVTFIEEQLSATTLLYLPDSPDGRCLRRYDSLEAARKGLFNLCLSDTMLKYLAGRALNGTVRAHESRLNRALLKHFDAVIGVGVRWPTYTSLAGHLLNAHMGRLIEAHRGSSRSNDAMYQERYALAGPRAFNYLKMALGLVPFVGSAFALYDAWTAANQAVAAFIRGDVGDGLLELESVLLSLIDAVMDLLPGEAASSMLSSLARSVTRARQARKLLGGASSLGGASMRQARHVAARFKGYEYEKPLSLTGLRPASHGLYRNIYRHADGDFIVRQGRIFQVERSIDSRNWRLCGTSRATYKQPIALDESGRWDTWYGVYGTTFEGGGLGGGAVLGHLVDALDPIWPQAIRQRLPRWLTDEAFRRQHRLTDAVDNLAEQLDARVKQSQETINKYILSPAETRPAQIPMVDAICTGDLEMAGRRYRMLTDLLPLTHGNKRRELIGMQSHTALLMADRFQHRVYFSNHRVAEYLSTIEAHLDRLDDLADDAFAEQSMILDDLRKTRVTLVNELDRTESLMHDFNYWYERITLKVQRDEITPQAKILNERLSDGHLHYLKTAHRLENVARHGNGHDVSWFYFQRQEDAMRARVDRAMNSQYNLANVNVTRAQRNQILRDCLDTYAHYRREMNAWVINYPQHFHLDEVPLLMEGIEKMAERARKGIDQPGSTRAAGRSEQKVFTTEDDQLLIGMEKWEPTLQKRHYTLTGPGGRVEIWEQASNGKFRLVNPPSQAPLPTRHTLAELLGEAQARLDSQETYLGKVQFYARQDMLPVDLEHMMVSEANELSHRAGLIEAQDPRNVMIGQLRDQANQLKTRGRQMRTRQTFSTKRPTDGMLEDLHGQGVVEIRKIEPLKNLGKRTDGRSDFIQEYEVWNVSADPAVRLWYAHFHYSGAKAAFRQFEKAHLKLPEHRYLTHADNPDLPYADISKRSPVLAYFENL